MKKGQTTEDGKTSSPECCSKGSEAVGLNFPGTNCHADHWRRESSASYTRSSTGTKREERERKRASDNNKR